MQRLASDYFFTTVSMTLLLLSVGALLAAVAAP